MLALERHALGDVVDRQQDLLRLVAGPINLARIEQHGAHTDRREDVFDLEERLHGSAAGNDGLERGAELGNVPLSVADFEEPAPNGLPWCDCERLAERAVREADGQIGREHDRSSRTLSTRSIGLTSRMLPYTPDRARHRRQRARVPLA